MSFLAPGFFLASLAVAAAVVALHFIVTRQPRAGVLPTARFVPDLPVIATARATRPSDLPLMLLRVLLVLAAGAGLARPVVTPSRGAEARVILVDASRSARDSIATRDSARALYRDHDAIVVFNSSARIIRGNVADSLAALSLTDKRGNLSAALIAAMRAGSSLRDRADSLQLVIVSPFAAEEMDAATDSIRKLWPGKARLVRIGAIPADRVAGASKLEIRAPAADPIQIAATLARNVEGASGVIVRSGAPDSGSVTSSGRALVEWPASERPKSAVQRAARDTIGGVLTGDALVISAFERKWSFPADSLRDADVIARWVDGEPAAIERRAGPGCVRSVTVPVSPVGDLVIRKDFVDLVTSLSRDCSQLTSLRPADPAVIAKLEGQGGFASREAFQPRGDVRSDIAPWLLAFAIAAAVAELFVRRRRGHAKAFASSHLTSREARAA